MIENIEDGTHVTANALVDSGATGLCINQDFINKYHLPIKKLPIRMPVINADGLLNENGSIEGFLEAQMTI